MPLPSFLNAQCTPLSHSQAHAFFTLLQRESQEHQKLFQREDAYDFFGDILFRRLALVDGLRVTGCAATWVLYISNSPGAVVLWAWTLRDMWLKTKQTVDMEMWTYQFPFGVPTPVEYERLWDAQKGVGPGGNRLDDPLVWVTKANNTPSVCSNPKRFNHE